MRFHVTVSYTRSKELDIYAADEGEAEEKALAIVSAWDGVDDYDVTDIEEAE